MYKYTVEYVKNNKVVLFVKTEEDVKGLEELNCKGHMVSLKDYPDGFYTCPFENDWSYKGNSYKKENFEIINASDFIKENLKTINKEIIGYKLIKPEYEEVIIKIGDKNIVNIRDNGTLSYLNKDKILSHHAVTSIEDLKIAGVLDLWFEPVYKSKEIIYNMGSFELKITKEGIFHKSENITEFVERVKTMYTYLPSKFGSYDCIVDEITFKKTGCESKGISKLSDWIKVYEEYKNLQ